MEDLNISRSTIEVLEENIGRKISDIPCSDILTDTSPKARDIKERIKKMGLHENKKLLHGERKQHNIKRELTVWGKHIC